MIARAPHSSSGISTARVSEDPSVAQEDRAQGDRRAGAGFFLCSRNLQRDEECIAYLGQMGQRQTGLDPTLSCPGLMNGKADVKSSTNIE